MVLPLPPKSAKISITMALARLKYEFIRSERRAPKIIIMHPKDADLYLETKPPFMPTKEALIFEDMQIVRSEDIKEQTIIIL